MMSCELFDYVVMMSSYTPQSDESLKTVREHRELISDIQTSTDKTMVITACKDTSAKVASPAIPQNRALTVKPITLPPPTSVV